MTAPPPPPAAVLVDALASYRIARLITTDEISAPLRSRVFALSPPPSAPSYLITCMHCTGVWAAAAMTVLSMTPPSSRLHGKVQAVRHILAVAGAVSAYRDMVDR